MFRISGVVTRLPFLAMALCSPLLPRQVPGQQPADSAFLLQPDHVFDGEQMHEGWQVLVAPGAAFNQASGPTWWQYRATLRGVYPLFATYNW